MATRTGTSGNDTLVGTNAADLLQGLAGNDRLNGLDGNDTLVGGNGNDTLNGGLGQNRLLGGQGNDTYIINSTTNQIVEFSGQGIDTVLASVSYTLGDYLNNLTLTGTRAINGTGNNLDNTLRGNNANNRLLGLAGNDRLIANVDLANDNEGQDTLRGGSGNDTLIADGGDRLFGEAGDDLLQKIGGGIDLDDETYLDGGAGNDTIESGYFGTIYGGDGDDLIYSDEGPGYGGNGNDTLTGSYTTLEGNDGNDVLSTRVGRLVGGKGNDIYIRLPTADELPGSSVYYATPDEGNDTIAGFFGSLPTEFSEDFDHIVVSAAGFGGGLVPGPGYPSLTIAPEQFVESFRAMDSSDRFIYQAVNGGGSLSFDVDGTGPSQQVLLATIVGTVNFDYRNIVVVA